MSAPHDLILPTVASNKNGHWKVHSIVAEQRQSVGGENFYDFVLLKAGEVARSDERLRQDLADYLSIPSEAVYGKAEFAGDTYDSEGHKVNLWVLGIQEAPDKVRFKQFSDPAQMYADKCSLSALAVLGSMLGCQPPL